MVARQLTHGFVQWTWYYRDSNDALSQRRSALHFPLRTEFCVTDDESSVYCCIAPIRLFSRVALHNSKSPILCDILPNLCRTELSKGQQPAPTEHSICHIAYHARFGNTKLYFCISELRRTKNAQKDTSMMIILQSRTFNRFLLLPLWLKVKTCILSVCVFQYSCNTVSVSLSEALPDCRQPLSVARQSRDRASVSILHQPSTMSSPLAPKPLRGIPYQNFTGKQPESPSRFEVEQLNKHQSGQFDTEGRDQNFLLNGKDWLLSNIRSAVTHLIGVLWYKGC